METLPTLAVDLIEALSKIYPQRCPEESWSERKIWKYTGAAELVQRLQMLVERDKNASITGVKPCA